MDRRVLTRRLPQAVLGQLGSRPKQAAGYSADMTVWQYAQLRVTYDNRLPAGDGEWKIAWHETGVPTHRTAGAYDGVVAELNRAGTQGWELVDVASLYVGDGVHSADQRDWLLTRYTFRRPHDCTVVKTAELFQSGERSQPVGTGQPADAQGGPSGSEPAALVRLTAYWLPSSEHAGSASEGGGLGSTDGRLLIRCETLSLRSHGDIGVIKSLSVRYQDPNTSKDQRKKISEKLKDAVASYAASQVQAEWDVSWWRTPESFPFAQASDELNGYADSLRRLVARPVADVASLAGLQGPAGSTVAGIGAELVTAPVTAQLEAAAYLCEVAGIVIGLATHNYPMVIACFKRLGHDKLGDALAKTFEQIIDPLGADREPSADNPSPDHTGRPAPGIPGIPPYEKIKEKLKIPRMTGEDPLIQVRDDSLPHLPRHSDGPDNPSAPRGPAGPPGR
jgi:hypothetical protein